MQTIPLARSSRADASFDEFVRARTHALTRTAYRLTGDWHHAEDLVQSVLLRVAGHWANIDDPDAYVTRALYTQAVSWWRRRPRREIPVADPTAGTDPTVADPDCALRLTLAAALARLTPKQRALLTLRYLEDRTEVEVADLLGIGLGTVKSQTRNALRRLRQRSPELRDLDPAGIPPEADPARDTPPATLPPDLYERGRRRQRRRRTAAAVGTGATVVALAALAARLLTGGVPAAPTPAAGGSWALSEGRTTVAMTTAWLLLAALLGWLGLRWRRRLRTAAMIRRLAATAVVGGLLILSAPPGTTLWGEPYRDVPGIPTTLVNPWMFTARASNGPPGRVAAAFTGERTGADLAENWNAAAVAADGPRYRMLQNATISPDGRFTVEFDDGNVLVDLVSGRRSHNLPQRDPQIEAWSADGSRIAYRVLENDRYGVWDLRQGRSVAEHRWRAFRHDNVGRVQSPDGGTANPLDTVARLALSPDGSRLAVQDGRNLLLYRVGEPAPYRQMDLPDAQLAGASAWTTDGRGVALAVAGTCTVCPDPRVRRTWRLVIIAADTGERLAAPAYPVMTGVTQLEVLGWRGPTEPVVQVHGTGRGLDPPGPAATSDGGPLAASDVSYENASRQVRVLLVPAGGGAPRTFLRIPAGVTDVHLATDLLSLPTYRPGPATFGPPTMDRETLVVLGIVIGLPLLLLVTLVTATTNVTRVLLRRRRAARAGR